MTKNNFLIIFALALLVVIISFILDFRAKRYYSVHSVKVMELETEAKELNSLKRMFQKGKIKSVVGYLKSLKPPSKDFKRGGVWILEFSNLDQNALRLFMRKILNSSLKLKNFRVMREKDAASLHLEINI